MSWETVKIGSLCKIKHGFAFKGKFFTNEGEYILLSPGNFFESGGLKSKGEKEKYYVGEFPSDYILNEEDLLVVMTDLIQNAPILGGCAIVPVDNKFLHNQRLGKITNLDENKIDKKFLYYCLNEENYRGQIRGSATGSTVRHTAPERIYNANIDIPTSLETQKRIASILSAYDDLIENNLKRIKLLEETAQNIYKEWFVNFRFPNYENTPFNKETGLPEGWENKGFEEISINNNRRRVPLSSTVRENKKGIYPYYGATGIIDYVNEFIFDGRYLLIAEDGTVTDEYGNAFLQLVEGQFWVSNHAHIICGTELPTEFIYLAMKHYPISHLITGAVQLKLSMQNLRRIELLVPDKQTLNSFMVIAKSLIQQVFTLRVQNQKLKEARDILLPRLMNRTIEV
jgi:type I restriction enzyme S subunit